MRKGILLFFSFWLLSSLIASPVLADILFPGEYLNPEYPQYVKQERFVLFGGFFVLNLLINLVFVKAILLVLKHNISWQRFLAFIPVQTLVGFVVDGGFFRYVSRRAFYRFSEKGQYITYLERMGPYFDRSDVLVSLLTTIGLATLAIGLFNFILAVLIFKLPVKKALVFAFIFMLLTSPVWVLVLETPIHNFSEKIIGPRPPMILEQ